MIQVNTIRELRLKIGMTQAEFAKLIGCKQNTFSQYEHGVVHPSIKIALAIIEVAKSKKIKVKLEDIFQAQTKE
jgi:DNA-binding XRE family transcriptional regulator